MAMKVRLDTLLVRRGLVESREKAQALIMAGQVDLDGRAAAKAGTMVDEAADVRVNGPDHPWASRGGLKLAHALDTFAIDVTGRLALDVGASTGGFTDVLLARGARRVIAVDVGHGQLHWRLRNDPRVTVIEGLNARHLTRDALPDLGDGAAIATIDVSFISLGLILPPLVDVTTPDVDVVALVKPQFEAGRGDVGRGGIVSDPAIHARVVDTTIALAASLRLRCVHRCASPITGGDGNVEFLIHLVHEDRA